MITKHGIVTAAKMTGTVTVTVHRQVIHPLYQKGYRLSKKFLADSKGMDVYVGDEVLITECRPLSKRKRFKVTEIIKAAPRVSELAEEKALHEVINREKNVAEETASPSDK
jgi:small subunit ribosomal protein S17